MTLPDPVMTLDAFVGTTAPLFGRGAVAAIICEDMIEVASTLEHLAWVGFRTMVVFAPGPLAAPVPKGIDLTVVACRTAEPGATVACVNAVIDRARGRWMHYCHNAEYLFYPFGDDRNIVELLRFIDSERRDSVVGVTVDLYPGDLAAHPDGVDIAGAHLDSAGYFGFNRLGPDDVWAERQYDIHGGLRWRMSEHIPPDRRRIDRVVLFRARRGLRLGDDHLLSDPELNTLEAPWHHSPTAAVASFRTAKAMMALPDSRAAIRSFLWQQSRPFQWRAQQLVELGLMEPGQWF